MDIRRETSIPDMIDFQIQSSWVPTTPVKPILPQKQPICADTQEKQLGHANWFAPERFSSGFSQETQALGCYDSTYSIDMNKGFDNWEADSGAKSQKDFSMDSDRAKHVQLANLMALANAAVTNSADVARQGDVNAASSPFISIFNSQFEDGNSIPSRPSYDLNSPPRALTDAFSSRDISPQLAPITPDLFKKAENTQAYDVHNLNVDERTNQAREKQGNEVATTRVEADKLHHDKEQQQIPKDLSSAPVSTQLQENHNPDNGGNPGIDLNITPQQKPRRKKHRPKVVIEGQPKRTRKPRTTKPAGSKENPTGKRKYVRKKGLNNTPGTPTAEVTGGSTDPETAPHEAKSSRRTLNFDFESQGREESSSFMQQSNDNAESQAQNFYTRVESKSTVQPDQGMGVMVIKAQQKRTPKPRTPIPAGSKENPTGKRKYVQKKGVNKTPGTPTTEVTGGSTDPETAPHEAKSCRRTLNFDFQSRGREESSSCIPQSNDNAESQAQNFYTRVESKSTVQIGQGMEVMVRKTQVGIAYDFTHSMNKVLEVYLPMPERQPPSPQSSTKTDPPHENLKKAHAQNECTRGKCQIVFSDETHDKQGSTIQMMINTDTQSAPRSPNDSNCNSSACLIEGEQARGLKRGSCTIDEAEPSHANVIGGHYYSLLEYLPTFPAAEYTRNRIPDIHFPAIHKKKRTEKGHSSTTSGTLSIVTLAENSERQATPCPLNNACAAPYTPESNCRFSATQFNTSSTSTKSALLIDAQGKQQTFECKLALDQRGRMTKKRSKGPTRVRNLASLIRIVECKQLPTFPAGGPPVCGDMQVYEISHRPHTCMEAMVADTRATMTTKKRTKRNFFASSLINNAKQKRIPTISAIVEYLEHLDINRESKQDALVLYQRDGTVVPFEGSFDPIRKRRPRPKVDLDEETTRVWKLLLENINSEGIDGTNEAKAQWWEGERRVFRGRADSFIARMHLVQGDRRFSPWKGSVVDSVVGVFLTQNVSDHLSSSAFMSLAARFPLKSKSNDKSCFEETSILVKEPEVCILNPEDAIKWYEEKSNRPACNRSSMTLHDIDYNVENEVVNSNELLGSSSSGVKSTYNSRCKCSDISKNDLDIYHKSTANRAVIQLTAVESFMGDKREMDDVLSSQNSAGSSQNSVDSSMVQTAKRIGSFLQDDSEADPTTRSNPNGFVGSSFMELLQRAETLCGLHNQKTGNVSTYKENGHSYTEGSECDTQKQNRDRSDNPKTFIKPIIPSSNYHSQMTPDSGVLEVESYEMMGEESLFSDISKKSTSEQSGVTAEAVSQAMVQKIMTANFQVPPKSTSGNNHACSSHQGEVNMIFQSQNRPDGNSQYNIQLETQEQNHRMQQVLEAPNLSRQTLDATESTSVLNNPKNTEHKAVESSLMDHGYVPGTAINGTHSNTPKVKGGRIRKQKQDPVDWDSLRLQVQDKGKRERTANTMDSLDWEAVRSAEVNKIADTIRERGMNNKLAERIKDFLNRLVREHGSIDLEWLRDVPPDKAKEYLLSFRGLGLKSVECVRLLTLHHLAFPVDTNVGRIAVRLGWVPLQPLPESLQLHLLELYPVLESIQRYLWPRLCKLDQRTLYELHYQMITFGKVFCTKSKPNCNACPMRGECRHFASAFASARLALPGPEEKSIVRATESKAANQNPVEVIKPWQLPLPQDNQQLQAQSQINNCEPIVEMPATPEPIVEVPATPEPEQTKVPDSDIEDVLCEDPEEIPTIKLNIEELTKSLQNYMQQNMELQEGVMSKALVALTPEAASIPMPKLKNVSRLRTEHQVYELPDSHPLLEGLEKREPGDPSPYLLAIWTPGETAISIQPPERRCSSQEFGKLCDKNTCFSCNSIREANSQTVRGTLLIPCRTAMRGIFPLNGTYFQVNEVFADHDSSIKPVDVPRAWIWNLPRRTVYFGTSIPTIFKGLSTENIQYCFWRGFVCVRGFDQKTRAPRPLMARLHFPASKLTRTKGKNDEKQE